MSTSIRPTRRLFFSAAGAAAAAPLAMAAPALAVPGGNDDIAARLARLEDENALRSLQGAYVRRVNARARAEIAELFAAEATGLDDSVRSLIAEEPVVDGIRIAADGKTATVRASFVVETETPIQSDVTIVTMARLQGDGVVRKSERRTLEISAVKVDGVWKIERTSWVTL